jgi:DNA-binding NtrC family response regulator
MTGESKPLVLVVEDDPLQRISLAEALRESGVDVIECESAEAGELVLARTGLELSLLVTDLNLAGVANGADLADFAHEYFPRLPVLLVSGEEDIPLPENVVFLRKPFQPADVIRRITSVPL